MPVSRGDAAIGVATTVLAVTAMAVDHLLGDDPGLEDPPAFLLSAGISIAVAAVVFGVVVRRATAESAAAHAVVLATLAVLALPLLFLGLSFPLAGAAVALGLRGRRGPRKGVATGALGTGALVLAFAAAAYGVVAVGKL